MNSYIGKAMNDGVKDDTGWGWLVDVMLEGSMSRDSLDKLTDINADANKLNKLLIKKED